MKILVYQLRFLIQFTIMTLLWSNIIILVYKLSLNLTSVKILKFYKILFFSIKFKVIKKTNGIVFYRGIRIL